MQINISTRHGRVSPATQEKVVSKVEKLSRFHERLTAVDVTIDLEHEETPQVEMRVSVERSDGFVATDRSNSLMGSLDATIHKLEQQLRKHKERITNHRPTGRRPE